MVRDPGQQRPKDQQISRTSAVASKEVVAKTGMIDRLAACVNVTLLSATRIGEQRVELDLSGDRE